EQHEVGDLAAVELLDGVEGGLARAAVADELHGGGVELAERQRAAALEGGRRCGEAVHRFSLHWVRGRCARRRRRPGRRRRSPWGAGRARATRPRWRSPRSWRTACGRW